MSKPSASLVPSEPPTKPGKSWVQLLQDLFPDRPQYIKGLTEEWFKARRGRITASTRAAIIATGTAKQWSALASELEYELSPAWKHEHVDNKAMAWGRDHEAEAISNVAFELGLDPDDLVDPGLLLHPDHFYAGGTPDFFIGSDVSGQIKCPFNPQNHLMYLYDKKLPDKYRFQVQFEAWVANRPRIVFASYDPRQPLATRTIILELDRDEALWETFERRLLMFKSGFEKGMTEARLVGVNGVPNIF
jgi:hypothetical protein